ncbi:MAG TPA: ABC transporter permease, partial [Longimicrobiales bacterium]|nr:ABC transporter permease [Longimicrobiales bacterium]
PVEGEIVSGNFFDVLGVAPLLGRTFQPQEDRTPGGDAVIVIGQGLWERRFGGDRSVLGSRLVVNGRPFTVIGVAPRSASTIDLGSDPQFWVPLAMHEVVLPSFRAFGIDLFGNRGTHWLDLVARLGDGVDRAAAAAALRALAVRQADEHPETNAAWSIDAAGAGEARAGPPGSRPLVWLTGLLTGVVVMVLLIACANVANLLLARAALRRREMAVRRAVGAGRWRLVRQVLTEALALALLGGGAGVVLAVWLIRLLPSLSVASALPGLDVRLDLRVLGFALGASVLTGVAFGTVPALRASAVNVTRSGGGTDPIRRSGSPRLPFGHLLVVVQVALSLVLLVGAGLTLQTLWNLRSVSLGFDPRYLRTASVDLSEGGYDAERELELYQRLLDQVRSLPGVRSASLARIPPFSRFRMANDIFWDAPDSAASRSRTNVDMNVVATDYFATMGIPVVRGRPFGLADAPGAVGAAVVNEALARRLWPGEEPLGKRLWNWSPGGPDEPLVVVGVVADGRYYRSWRTGERPFLFMALSQHPASTMVLHVRASGPGEPDGDALRRAVAGLAPSTPPPRVRSAREAMADSVELERT